MEEQGEKKEKNAEVQEKKKKSPLILIGIVVGVLALLGGGGVIAWKNFVAPSQKVANKAGDPVKDEVGVVIPLDTFIVNLADTETNKYLKVVIKIEAAEPKVNEEVQKRMSQLRDVIITLLTSQTFSDVKTLKGKTALRTEILNRINSHLTTGKVQKVYFTDFVIQ